MPQALEEPWSERRQRRLRTRYGPVLCSLRAAAGHAEAENDWAYTYLLGGRRGGRVVCAELVGLGEAALYGGGRVLRRGREAGRGGATAAPLQGLQQVLLEPHQTVQDGPILHAWERGPRAAAPSARLPPAALHGPRRAREEPGAAAGARARKEDSKCQGGRGEHDADGRDREEDLRHLRLPAGPVPRPGHGGHPAARALLHVLLQVRSQGRLRRDRRPGRPLPQQHQVLRGVAGLDRGPHRGGAQEQREAEGEPAEEQDLPVRRVPGGHGERHFRGRRRHGRHRVHDVRGAQARVEQGQERVHGAVQAPRQDAAGGGLPRHRPLLPGRGGGGVRGPPDHGLVDPGVRLGRGVRRPEAGEGAGRAGPLPGEGLRAIRLEHQPGLPGPDPLAEGRLPERGLREQGH
mmetsp:Transcript_69707/g.179721  ORF Transcript_69707/g.179721 Transcript_69707/m.179721 type:complete len:405 (-) Transcript_69707:86-1300(-)